MTASSEMRPFATPPEGVNPASNRTPINSAVIVQFVGVLFSLPVCSFFLFFLSFLLLVDLLHIWPKRGLADANTTLTVASGVGGGSIGPAWSWEKCRKA